MSAILADRSARWAVAMLCVYVVAVLPTLEQPLLETHAHRQTQTAYTALLYAERGIDLLRPPLPILGPPGSIPQEFPVVQALGSVMISAGMPADPAMRIVGLVTFVLSAGLLWLLARQLMSNAAALVALGAFTFNAHAWLYGRASLIEYAATAGGLGFLYLALRWMQGGGAFAWLGAVLAGVLGILVKITTGGFYLLPALLWRSPDGRWGFQRPGVLAMVAIPIAVGLAWSAWAQAVREETPASIFLSMENQFAWFFGSLDMRLDPGTWRLPLVALIALSGFGIVIWAPLAVARARAERQSAFIIGLLSLVVVMPLLLFNLYAIHDYYWVAVAPVVAMAIGLGFDWLRTNWGRRRVRLIGVGLAGAWVATIIGSYASWSIIYREPAEEDRAMRIASFVRDHSAEDDWVVLSGWGWNSTFFYYAHRQGLAVPERVPDLEARGFGTPELSDIDLAEILADPRLGPFIVCDRQADCAVEERS